MLIDGENIDTTLGQSVLGRKPEPTERPRWERVMEFARQQWGQPVKALFFLNASGGTVPYSFVQALVSFGYTVLPVSGAAGEKVVDMAIVKTMQALISRAGDVLLLSHDVDFVPGMRALQDGQRRSGWSPSPNSSAADSPSWSPAVSPCSTWRTTPRPSTPGSTASASSRSRTSTRPGTCESSAQRPARSVNRE